MFDRVLLRTRTPVLTGWGKSEDYFNAPVLPMLEGAYVSGRETIYAAVKHTLGDSFTWHDSPEALEKACPPDENYGKPA